MYLFLFDLVLIFIMAKSCSLSFSTCVGIALSSAGTPPCNPEDATIKTSKQNFREREREWEWVGERSSRVREEWTTDTKTTMKMAMKIEKLDIGFPHAILWSRRLGAASQTERERLKKREKKKTWKHEMKPFEWCFYQHGDADADAADDQLISRFFVNIEIAPVPVNSILGLSLDRHIRPSETIWTEKNNNDVQGYSCPYVLRRIRTIPLFTGGTWRQTSSYGQWRLWK